MSVAGISLVSFGSGFVTCWIVLVWPARRLLQRWTDFYADDLKAARDRKANT